MYEIELTDSATKQYNDLPKAEIDYITEAIDALEQNPRHSGCRKLKGEEAYRVRAGNYRIIYEIHDKVLLVLVVRIKHRKDVYKKK